MARKKSETPQGDGAPTGPGAEGRDQRAPRPRPPSRTRPLDPASVPEPSPASARRAVGSGDRCRPTPARRPRSSRRRPRTSPAVEAVTHRRRRRARGGGPRPDRRPDRDRAHEPVPVVDSVEEPREELHEEEAGWSLPARVLAVLCLLIAGAGLGIWAAPRIAPMLPSGMAPVARWLTPGQAEVEAEIAALAAKVDSGLGAIDSRVAALPASADVDTRIGAAVGDAQAKLSAEIEAARAAAATADLTAVNQKLAALEAGLADEATRARDPQGADRRHRREALGRGARRASTPTRARSRRCAARWGACATRSPASRPASTRSSPAPVARSRRRRPRSPRSSSRPRPGSSAAAVAADLAEIRAAIAGGQPFAQPLATLAGQGWRHPAGRACRRPPRAASRRCRRCARAIPTPPTRRSGRASWRVPAAASSRARAPSSRRRCRAAR